MTFKGNRYTRGFFHYITQERLFSHLTVSFFAHKVAQSEKGCTLKEKSNKFAPMGRLVLYFLLQ